MQTAPKGWFQHNQVGFFLQKKKKMIMNLPYHTRKKKHRLLK